jgi:hypothetical protein
VKALISSYLFPKNLTIKEEKAVKILRLSIPTRKLNWSATIPKIKGWSSTPKIASIVMMNPVVIDLSRTGVNLEIVVRATRKKAFEMRYCSMRVIKINERIEEKVKSPPNSLLEI